MKKILLTLLAVIVVVGALAGAGFVGYRIGYTNGATASGNVPFFGRGCCTHESEPHAPQFWKGFWLSGAALSFTHDGTR